MVKNHLKRLNVPKTWNIWKHGRVFITRPNPGSHSLKTGIPVNMVVRDLLNITNTSKETISLLQKKEVMINGKRTKDHRQIMGLMDILGFKDTKQYYRLVLNKKGKLVAIAISEEEAKKLPLRIIGKTQLKNNKTQLNLFGGRNIIVGKNEYKTGDTLILETDTLKIKDSLKFEKGMTAYLIGGQHTGNIGTIEDIKKNNIIYKNKKGEVFETLKKYAYIIGKTREAIKIS